MRVAKKVFGESSDCSIQDILNKTTQQKFYDILVTYSTMILTGGVRDCVKKPDVLYNKPGAPSSSKNVVADAVSQSCCKFFQ